MDTLSTESGLLDNQASESGHLNVNSAAEAFGQLLSGGQDAPQDPLREDEPSTSEPDEATESQPDAPAADEATKEPTYTVKVDGKDVEVTLDELRNGYQRQSDYTRKTMELASKAKEADAVQQAVQQERNAYQQNLAYLQSQLGNELQQMSQTDWQQLLDTNPHEYLRQQHLYQQRQAAYQQATQESQRLEAQQRADMAKRSQEHRALQEAALLEALPDWKDAAKASAEKAELAQFLKDHGFSQGEIDGIADHRAVLLARNAMQFAKLMKAAPESNKKVEKLPTKAERPGTAAAPSNTDKRQAAINRLGKTGKIDDAAEAFKHFL